MRSTKFFIGVLGLCAAVVAAPVEFSSEPGLVGPNLAAAKPGKGNGQGRGRGPGAAAGQSSDVHGAAHGHAKDGHASGQANGHAPKNAVSGGVEHAPPGHAKKEGYNGVKGHLGVQGSFNAIHSAAINKGVVSPRSQIARIEAYLDAAQTVSDIDNGVAEVDGDDREEAIEAAALAAADASNKAINPETLDAVHDYSNERGLTEPGIDMSDKSRDAIAEQSRGEPAGP